MPRDPLVVENLPFDKYELEPSPLTQYILERRQPNTAWQVRKGVDLSRHYVPVHRNSLCYKKIISVNETQTHFNDANLLFSESLPWTAEFGAFDSKLDICSILISFSPTLHFLHIELRRQCIECIINVQ